MEAPIGGSSNKALEVDGMTLQTFKNRVDELLISLDESPAQHRKIGEQKVTADSYGTGFAAAKDLHAAYEKIRTRLESLSKTFGDTIEAMGLTVHVADKGYTGVDEEERERFQAIQKRLNDEQRRREAVDQGSGKKDEPANTGTNTGDSGGFS